MSGYVIGLLGMSKVGKDEIGKIFVENGYERYAFGDIVKKEVASILKIKEEDLHNQNKERYRDFLISHGEGKRIENPNYWIDKISDEIEDKIDNNSNIVITDIRRVPEVNYIKKLKTLYPGKVFLVEVSRPLKNGGYFDFDAETSKAILYARYNKLIDIRFKNKNNINKLEKWTNNIINQLKQYV